MEAGGGGRPDHHVRRHHRPFYLHQLEKTVIPLLQYFINFQGKERQKLAQRRGSKAQRELGAVPAGRHHQVRDHRREGKEGRLPENKEQAERQENEL